MRAWKRDALDAHARLTTVLAMAVAGVVLVWGAPPMPIQIAACVALVGVVGLPHGAVDLDVARRRWAGLRSSRGAIVFVVGYVAVAAVVVAAWRAAPAPSLLAFLLISAWHFGRSESAATAADRPRTPVETLALGALPISLPAAFHGADVATIFTALMTDGSRFDAGTVRAFALPVTAAALAVLLLAALQPSRRAPTAETGARVALVACLIACPPLIGFTLYFCGWHSMREIISEASTRDESSPRRGVRAFARAALPATLAALVGGALMVPVVSNSGLGDAALRIVFVGLAALTVPHMLIHAKRPQRSPGGAWRALDA